MRGIGEGGSAVFHQPPNVVAMHVGDDHDRDICRIVTRGTSGGRKLAETVSACRPRRVRVSNRTNSEPVLTRVGVKLV